MKALLLGAGYALRLYPLTRDRPKPLLPVGGIPIIQRVLERVLAVPGLEVIYIVSNHRFVSNYYNWLADYRSKNRPPIPIDVYDDMTSSPDDRLGAIGDINFVIKNAKIKDDLLVVAGDNLIEFDLAPFVTFATKRGSSVALKDIGASKLISQYSVVQLDQDNMIIDFEEKPPIPKGSLVSTGMYYFFADTLPMIQQYLELGYNPDAPGYYVQWLYKKIKLYGYIVEGIWFDIGDIDSYKEANDYFLKD